MFKLGWQNLQKCETFLRKHVAEYQDGAMETRVESTMYQKIDVWRQVDTNLVLRYQCLKRLSDSLYRVSSQDYLRKTEKLIAMEQSDGILLDRLWHDNLDEGEDWYPTLIEAIGAFDAEFDEPEEDTRVDG